MTGPSTPAPGGHEALAALAAGYVDHADGVTLCRIDLTAILAVHMPGSVVLTVTHSGLAPQTFRLPPAAAERLAHRMLDAARAAARTFPTLSDCQEPAA